MVFENLVVYLLDKYLGDYIENLDTKKLKIDLWSGNVVLENLYLKPNALADLNLPVTISIGYLQKLVLQVPWKNLYTHPTKATIDGLYLLVIPKTEVEYDAKRDEKEQHEAKMKEVLKIEELRKEKEAAENAKATDKSNDTFVERMQLQVIRNLELSIENIHIVYEDRSTKPDHPFALGITLNYIKLHTTTPDWKQTVLKEDTPLIHKLGELRALSIYWNTNAKSRSGLPRDEALKNLRERIAVDSQTAPADISYILRPLNITARVVLVMKPRQEDFKKPMFDIKVDLDEISLNINRDQYLDLLDLLEFQDYLSTKSRYIKYQIKSDKPTKSSEKNWKFAYAAIVNEEVRPRFECYKWENIKAHLDRCREYRKIHLQELTGKITNE
jgi:vacuolar protein sorting-associated protein 13A/C